MEQKENKKNIYSFRALHRDLGYFAIGLIIIYSLSGIVLVYRETNLLKKAVVIEKKLSPDLEATELGSALRFKELKVIKNDPEIIYFQDGTYNKTTGMAVYNSKVVLFPIDKFIALHKSSSSNPVHYFNIFFGVVLIVLAVTSFWMFKKGSVLFRRSLYFTVAGILVTILILLI